MTREVRVTVGFLEQLDAQLRPERGPNGEPSATDFIEVSLANIIARFAEEFDKMPEAVPGVPSTRMFIGPGVVVRSVVVYGVLVNDIVELISIGVDA